MKREESLERCEEGIPESVKREDWDPKEGDLQEDAKNDEDIYRGRSNSLISWMMNGNIFYIVNNCTKYSHFNRTFLNIV